MTRPRSREFEQSLDAAYLLSKGANIFQVMAWCVSYPSGGSRTNDMDDYLKGNDQ